MRELAHPDLQPYIVESNGFFTLQHPLVCMPLFSEQMLLDMQESLLAQIAQKQARIKEARETRNWSHYLVMHERPWRLPMLAQLALSEEATAPEIAEHLAYVWSDCESIGREECNVKAILDYLDKHGCRPTLDETAKQMVEAATNEQGRVRIYRGHGPESRDGRCWTLSPCVAAWFADRHEHLWQAGSALVTSALVPSEAIYTVLLGRDESEVILKDIKAIEQPYTLDADEFRVEHGLEDSIGPQL